MGRHDGGMMEDKKYESWNNFITAIEKLTHDLDENELGIDAIYGIPRGGLCLGTTLSHKFKIPLIIKEKHIKKYTKVLIVDDISDSGDTLQKLTSKYDSKVELVTATWHYNSSRSIFEPDYWVEDNVGKWVVYPWEWR